MYKLLIATLFFGLAGCSTSGDFEKLQLLVNDINFNTIKNGQIQLPENQKALTADGCMYVTKTSNGRLMIIFKTWIGKGANMRGYLYASSPLESGDITKDYYGNNVIALFGIEYVIKKTANLHWYTVEFLLD